MRRPSVLVVDDDAFARAVVSKRVAKLSDVVEAEDGLDALAHLNTAEFDLAIVDLEMPNFNILDLDHFKHVNDTLGHPVGDKLLQLVAKRLRALVRETDTVARMGGDEFAIVQAPLVRRSDAESLALRVIDALGQPYEIDGHQ